MPQLELLVEEYSMEAFLDQLLSRVLPRDWGFSIHSFRGKNDLLRKLGDRLRGYARWLPDDWYIIVLIDRDNKNCHELKQELEKSAQAAGLRTKRQAADRLWQVANRIVIEELEAWYFGDWEAVRCAYSKVKPKIPENQRYRKPDEIRGGTWEAFERILQRSGYFKGGLNKVLVAEDIGSKCDPMRNSSPSFRQFYDTIQAIIETNSNAYTGQTS